MAQKQRGELPFEISPLLSDFSKIWFGVQITPIVTPELLGTCELAPAFPLLFRHSIRCKSFLVPSIRLQLPGCFCEFRSRPS